MDKYLKIEFEKMSSSRNENNLISHDDDFKYSFMNSISESFYLRLSPALIGKEIAFFFICLSIFLMLGNDYLDVDESEAGELLLYIPIIIGLFLLLKASLWSMLPGFICISISLFLHYFQTNFHYLYFISPRDIHYLFIFGLGVLPLSFIRSY